VARLVWASVVATEPMLSVFSLSAVLCSTMIYMYIYSYTMFFNKKTNENHTCWQRCWKLLTCVRSGKLFFFQQSKQQQNKSYFTTQLMNHITKCTITRCFTIILQIEQQRIRPQRTKCGLFFSVFYKTIAIELSIKFAKNYILFVKQQRHHQ
jgi:hypothetical protein